MWTVVGSCEDDSKAFDSIEGSDFFFFFFFGHLSDCQLLKKDSFSVMLVCQLLTLRDIRW
jgi:hypothetical protein